MPSTQEHAQTPAARAPLPAPGLQHPSTAPPRTSAFVAQLNQVMARQHEGPSQSPHVNSTQARLQEEVTDLRSRCHAQSDSTEVSHPVPEALGL